MSLDLQWATYVSALNLPVIAGFGAWIGYRQWWTARDKLKFDLFDRRMSVYQAATAELVRAWGGLEEMGTGEGVADQLKLEEAKWLTSDGVAAYLDGRFQESLNELAEFRVVLDGHDTESPDYDWDGHDARLEERTRMYRGLVRKLDEVFSPFLTLKH
ncbi:hypothetical protein SAMN04487926_119133 [Paraburkholderia steynii]|uniref:Uncharacterized protein n=1 Tax=Paraburkholderia steynii TaxID=1245441 RepID=A0A7Z7FJM0_9BURK|nr:hypothetical protein [Paraburkholderia steynii]SDI57591.1 hypothetical protein SAMN04487926_119133 [Paraburkholderia steynii]